MAEAVGVSQEEVLRVAELANLELTPDEVPRMQRDLNAILGHIVERVGHDRGCGDGSGGRDSGRRG